MDYTRYAVEQILALCKTPSPTGFTKVATKYLIEELSAMGYEAQVSRKGSVLANLGGEGNPLILAAHIDTLGAM
ncbi:MAG: peptidase M42, partial [Candidatus Cloacimonetes bacterium]|nr:peptidase M42 [Candidatus Cloacimonadota bacterium]